MISTERVINWMNVIRETTDKEQYRILESFWESQLKSKQWIIDTIKKENISCSNSVYIFGGWFGVLGGMLRDNFKDIENIYSVDVDPYVGVIGKKLNPDVIFITGDMQDFKYTENLPTLIINTSTEHITQSVFDSWLKNIPQSIPVTLQGNNYFSCTEHIRCTTDLNDFKSINKLDTILYEGELDCTQFTRYMTIGYKL